MIRNIHMQDQIHNKVEELMNEKADFNWDEAFQNATTFSIIILFLSLGLNW